MNDKTPSPDPKPTFDPQALAQALDAQPPSWTLIGLLLVAVLTVLRLAREVAMPIVMALLLSLMFLPVVRGMKKLRIPAPLGAGIIVLGLLAAFLGGVYNLAEPAGTWLDRAPQSLREIDKKLRRVTGAILEVATATAQVQDLTQQLASGGGTVTKVQEVTVKAPTLAGTVLYGAKEFALTAVSTLVLLYFLLASGDMFLRKTIAATPRLADKKRAADIAQQVEATVSRYLLTVTLINAGLGCVVALAMSMLGVPNPMLWGVMVGLFNFVPYLGNIASFGVLTIVGLLTFDDLWRGLLVPGVIFVLDAAEGYLITPLILGRSLSLNPVVIVLSVLFWGWMWGVPGALLAVPILVVVKTVCDRIEPLRDFGDFLGG